MKRLIVLYAVLVACGCPKPAAQHPTPPPPSDSSWCGRAYQKLLAMHCPQATAPDGRSFEVVCIETDGNGVNLHPECIATNLRVTRCEDVDPICSWGE